MGEISDGIVVVVVLFLFVLAILINFQLRVIGILCIATKQNFHLLHNALKILFNSKKKSVMGEISDGIVVVVVLFLFVLAILWFLLPFAIFGTKDKLSELIALQSLTILSRRSLLRL
jgi:hypothetical protein